ncbi:23543_t:CDS:10 [Cetraspora pellucida]|uniref:23543_t:CDS:1 n=1 Tax=Cetraspora pellucida TaxID=1433469 RepID=A0A9N9BEN9_9GLOM|nr:23543_t:CDS:10 [Cetraspora pellucida]
MVKFTIILYVIILLSLLPSPSTQLQRFTYQDPQAGLDLIDYDKSNDGTIILRFGKPITQVNGSTMCWDKTIYLRIIHPNASISFFSISNHDIPDFNFCLINGTNNDYTKIWGFDQGLMLLTFHDSSNATTSAIMAFYVLERGFAIAYGGDDSLNSTANINSFNVGTTNGSNDSQTLIQTSTLQELICNVDFDGAGNICMLILTSQYNITNTTSQPTLLKISYLSSGSVTKIGEMKNVNFTNGFNLIPLRFGGYLMTVYQDVTNFGYVLEEDGNVYCNWSLPQPLYLPQHKSGYAVLTNNSIVVVENQNDSIWSITRDDLYRFYGQDNRYNNPIIESTNPIIGSQVNESTRQLLSTFTYPVTLSSSNVSIYQQIIGSNDLLRQRFNGDSSNPLCRLDPNNNKSILIQVLPSTFNEPNSLYYVVIENNFVKRSDSNEALLGVDKNLWTLVAENKQYVYSSKITGIIRLTPDGSNYFLSLSSANRLKFHEQIAADLSSVIPVEDNRLTAADGFEKDMSTGTLQILLPFNIKDTTDLSKKSTDKISQDLNTLLTYKKYSALMDYNTTALIDETYSMTIAHARKVPELWLPTLMILVISTSTNMAFSFMITVHEIGKNPKFNKWFSEYGHFLPLLTIISTGHIEALNVLTSKFGMLEIFSTTFSKTAEKTIFIVGILGLIIGEIPQFIIQVGTLFDEKRYFGV